MLHVIFKNLEHEESHLELMKKILDLDIHERFDCTEHYLKKYNLELDIVLIKKFNA